MSDAQESPRQPKDRVGLLVASSFGALGLGLVVLTTPFLLPALRRHCLPYVPATNEQLVNLATAFKRHSSKGDSFIDIGSGDGRVCRLARQLDLYSRIHGVELNNWLVLYSRAKSLRDSKVNFFKRDLWKFPLCDYDSLCIFGVDTMMDPLERYLSETNTRKQTVFACRFPFEGLQQTDEIGTGIDTVWVYKLDSNKGPKVSRVAR